MSAPAVVWWLVAAIFALAPILSLLSAFVAYLAAWGWRLGWIAARTLAVRIISRTAKESE